MTLAAFIKALPWVACVLLFSAACGLLWWTRRDTLKMGALKEDNKTEGQVLDDIAKGNAARERLRTDPAYADKLRSKYSRD